VGNAKSICMVCDVQVKLIRALMGCSMKALSVL
jgi:hypothetical protein